MEIRHVFDEQIIQLALKKTKDKICFEFNQ